MKRFRDCFISHSATVCYASTFKGVFSDHAGCHEICPFSGSKSMTQSLTPRGFFPSGFFFVCRVESMVDPIVGNAYRRMKAIENDIGGGEGIVGIYGSLGPAGMQYVLDSMAGLGPQSVFVDIGTGLGKPLVHAVLSSGVRCAYGFELDPVKFQKARTMMERLRNNDVLTSDQFLRIRVRNQDVGTVIALPIGTTHVYSFWQGFNDRDKMALGALWRHSPTARYITVVGNVRSGWGFPEVAMAHLGFGPLILTHTRGGLRGGAGTFTAWTFRKPLPTNGGGMIM